MHSITSRVILTAMFPFLLMPSTAFIRDDPGHTDAAALIGRWNLTFDIDGQDRPGWLEVSKSGVRTLVGQIVVIVGSARPISEVHYKDGMFSFSIPPQWEQGEHNLTFEGRLVGDRLTGTMVNADGKTHAWTGVKAPALRLAEEPRWGAPILLFNGTDLSDGKHKIPPIKINGSWKMASFVARVQEQT